MEAHTHTHTHAQAIAHPVMSKIWLTISVAFEMVSVPVYKFVGWIRIPGRADGVQLTQLSVLSSGLVD